MCQILAHRGSSDAQPTLHGVEETRSSYDRSELQFRLIWSERFHEDEVLRVQPSGNKYESRACGDQRPTTHVLFDLQAKSIDDGVRHPEDFDSIVRRVPRRMIRHL